MSSSFIEQISIGSISNCSHFLIFCAFLPMRVQGGAPFREVCPWGSAYRGRGVGLCRPPSPELENGSSYQYNQCYCQFTFDAILRINIEVKFSKLKLYNNANIANLVYYGKTRMLLPIGRAFSSFWFACIFRVVFYENFYRPQGEGICLSTVGLMTTRSLLVLVMALSYWNAFLFL